MRMLPLLALVALPAAAAPKPSPVPKAKAAVLAEVDTLSRELGRLASELWGYSEIALREERSSNALADLLEREGFRVERGVADMPTAFVASFGSNFTVEFSGKAAHGARDPWNGRSALDAVEVMTHAANLMREHLPTSARIHYVIPQGGEAPNVVPAHATVWFYVRDVDRPAVERHYEWLLRIAEAAALATQTTHEVTLTTGVHEYNLNRPLQEAMQRNLELVGAPAWGDEEQRFARELQEFLKLPEKGLDASFKQLAASPEPLKGGSTDAAEVSHLAPTGALIVATAGIDLPWHSWATAASHGVPGAARGSVVAAKVLAATGVDILTDPRLLARAQEFFRTKAGGRPFKSPLPAGQKPPTPEPGH